MRVVKVKRDADAEARPIAPQCWANELPPPPRAAPLLDGKYVFHFRQNAHMRRIKNGL